MVQQIKMRSAINRDFAGSGGTRGGRPDAVSITPSAAQSFLARTSGLDAIHTEAYTVLIDGLVTDGILAKLDVLHIYWTQDSTTSLLNLVQNLYNGTAQGSPTFTADVGYTFNFVVPTYIDSNFNPGTAPSPKHVQNSAHLSSWAVTDIANSQPMAGCTNGGASNTDVFPKWVDNNAYFFINCTSAVLVANAVATGHYLANRSSSVALQGYKNGNSIVSSGANASATPPSFNIICGGQNNSGTVGGSSHTAAMLSIGASLDATDTLNFYNRLQTFINYLSTRFDGTSAFATVSLNQLTYTATGAGIAGVRSTRFQTAGKFYFEVVLNSATSLSDSVIGIAQAVVTYAQMIGLSNLTRSALINMTGDVYAAGTFQDTVGGGSNWTAGAVACIAVDFTANKIWFRKNNGAWSLAGDPATGTGAITIASGQSWAPICATQAGEDDSLTGRFLASSWAFAAPSGFGAWI